MVLKDSATKVAISSEGRVLPPDSSSPALSSIEARLSRIEVMLGITQQQQDDDVVFDHAATEYLKGNKKPLQDYYKQQEVS